MFFEATEKKKTPQPHMLTTPDDGGSQNERAPLDPIASRAGSIPPKYERPAAIARHSTEASR
jgi:hypothetical protein